VKELVKIQNKEILASFSSEKGMDPVLAEAQQIVADFEHDMSTVSSRAKTTGLASKVARLKTTIDGLGKDLVSDWKLKSRAVDQNRKYLRDELDELKILARKPLTDWEDEQEKIREEQEAKAAAIKLRIEIETAHEFADLIDREFDREKADKLAKKKEKDRLTAERLENERLAREKTIREEAAEQARIEAENIANAKVKKAKREKQEALDREKKLKDEAKQAKLDKIEAEKQAKINIENARLAEIKRQKDKKAQELADLEKRESDKRHVNSVMNKAKVVLAKTTGINLREAEASILAIKNGDIPAVTISF